MHKVGIGTDESHAQTKFFQIGIKQKRFRNNLN